MRHLIEWYIELRKKIGEIIGYGAFDNDNLKITPMLDTKWMIYPNNEYINFDREEEGDMGEYCKFIISSYASKGENFYIGERAGFMFIMAHDELGWNSAQVFIFSMNNRIN